jgi:hypothetical protein
LQIILIENESTVEDMRNHQGPEGRDEDEADEPSFSLISGTYRHRKHYHTRAGKHYPCPSAKVATKFEQQA